MLHVGGPWHLPTKRPAALRPMLLKKEYKEFAHAVNRIVAWNPWSSEMLLVYFTAIFMPPLMAVVLVSR